MTTNQNHPDDHLAIEALHSRYLDVLTGRTSDHLLMFQDEAYALGRARGRLDVFRFDLHLERQRRFSERTFGPGSRAAGVIDHIRKELREIEEAPVVQAQHSVPKEFIGRLSEFLAQRGATGKALLRELRDMLAAAPARGQHSVPAYVSYTTRPAESLAGIALRQLKDESRWVEIRDINAHAFPDMQSHSYYPAGTVIKLPAAAPGKEVGHE